MNPTILGNFCLQAKFGSVLRGHLQNLSQYMTTCNPSKCVATCMSYGEKTVFPFADDIAELVLHRCRSDKVEDKKFGGKKDFKKCKGGLSIRHAMIRSHIAANSAVFNLNKATPLVLMTIADPNYQPIMEELCSTERYIDAEIVHRKMVADRLLNGLSSPRNFSVLKLKIKPISLKNEREFLEHSNKRNKPQAENMQLLAYRISRTKRLIGRDFSPLSTKRIKLSSMHAIKPVKGTGKAVENTLILCDSGAALSKPLKSMLLNRVLKGSNNCKSNINQN
ncbi:hypothetical protein AVEN_157554-1 [Araneus ventricosus]|uniref:Uncharacterized protein n=1 Tax=Araneus ventricosus TaxID=182803 RepID=A0A4Y2KDR9_ARAVE|nr:hypothetical protein AVEN_157554-1 [Araneus ventricosus]